MSVASLPPKKEACDMDNKCGTVYESPQYSECLQEIKPTCTLITNVDGRPPCNRSSGLPAESGTMYQGAYDEYGRKTNPVLHKSLPPLKSERIKSPTEVKRENREHRMENRIQEFKEKGVNIALQGTIEHKVKCATMSTDHLLVQKRTKLRELLLAEDVAYTAEYVAKCQKAAMMREELLKSRAVELQAKLQREREQYVDQKLLEHKVETCDALRLVLAQKNLKDVKKDQLWQIKEKYVLNEAKREEERMYHDLMIKNMMAVKEKEEENAKMIWFKQRDAQIAFDEQIKKKKQIAEEEKKLKEIERLQLEEEIRQIKEEAKKETSEKMQRNERIKAEFREAMIKEREVKQRRKKEEEEIDRAFNELLKVELEKEKRKELSNKERLKREMDVFLEKSRELKIQREAEEKKFDEMVKEYMEKKRIQKDEERKKLKEARKELFLNVLKEREEQIKEKRIREKQLEDQRQAEIELLALQIEQQRKVREEFERRCAVQREEYRCQLLQQMKEVEEAKKMKKEAENEFNRKLREQQEREVEELKNILQNLPNADKPHPMKEFLRETPPRYVCPYPHPM